MCQLWGGRKAHFLSCQGPKTLTFVYHSEVLSVEMAQTSYVFIPYRFECLVLVFGTSFQRHIHHAISEKSYQSRVFAT